LIESINKTFYERTGKRLGNTSQVQLFSILKDKRNNVDFINIFKSYKLNEDLKKSFSYDLYEVQNDDWWENISFKYYGTPDLWWIIALVNEVMNPFEHLEDGMNLYILKPAYLYQMLKEIRNIGSEA